LSTESGTGNQKLARCK